MPESVAGTTNGADVSNSGGFIGQICAYFRDFLDTDFRRQKMPKRTIGLKDHRGNLIGISVAKYPELVADLWIALGKPLNSSRNITITASRNKYRSRINPDLLEVIHRHVNAVKETELLELGDQIKATARELRQQLENDPDRYRETIVAALRNGLVRTTVVPLLRKLEASFEKQGSDSFEKAYDIEDELGSRLIADIAEPISSGVATAIVENHFDELDAVIEDTLETETIRRRIAAYFETFHTNTFFDELHQLCSTLKLRENFEIYLYVGALQHSSVSYPLFYIPIEVALESGLFRITADPQIYINKKAIDYAAQETARELGRPIGITIKDRVIYLDDTQTFVTAMQGLLDRWCADLALKPPIDLLSPIDQKAQRSQLAVSNAIHFAAFDKSDESLLNDYEELMTLFASGSDITADFQQIVSAFLTRDPIDVNSDVDLEWSDTPIERRLVFQSPVPLNEEQRKILMALHHKNARFLSIEGPPGTGKSHTITAIVFDAILKGQNVLVLSDKSEALDVVENKLEQVLNSVRFDKNFENPILRLGRSSNSYGRILSNSSIQAIKAHLAASSASSTRLVAQIQEEETHLSGEIKLSASYGSTIKLNDVYEVHQRERYVDEILDFSVDLGADEIALDVIDAAVGISGFLSTNNGAILKILRTMYQRVHFDGLEAFLKLQRAFDEVGMPSVGELDAMRFFSTFHEAHLGTLHAIISEYHAVRWPVVRFLFSGRRIRALDGRVGTELSPVSALHAYRNVARLELAHSAFSKLSSALIRAGVRKEYHCIVFQQAIEGLPPQSHEAEVNLERIARVRAGLEQCPYLKAKIGLDVESIDDWTSDGSSVAAKKLREVFSYVTYFKRLKYSFNKIPEFDYVGDKAKLESLQAQRLAHTLDSQVIEFADKNRNLAVSIRDIIRKKQKFPRESFAALKKAFPCMIASIRDFAEYVPLESGLFDIVVIDEASQVSIAQAFPAFIRAKKLVVLGDRKQFSNVKTATASIQMNNLYANEIIKEFRKQHTPDINTLNRLKLFNIKTSVLEFVERIANSQAMLKKHFRGYPELISFSSKTFYQSQLQAVKIRGVPIDDVICFSPVDHDGRIETRKNINTLEYDAILKELRRLAVFEPAPSVGIITPFTEQQTLFVQKLAAEPDAENLQENLRLKIMTFDSCQGEERDVIIYSMVATPQQDKLAYIFPKSLAEADEVDFALRLQRLNVGFSRAKERIHIFHSQPLESFRGAIGQALNHYRGQLELARTRPEIEDTDPSSPMEARVLHWLGQTKFIQKLGDLVEIDAQFELGDYLRQIDPRYKHPAYRVDFLLRVQSQKGTINIIIEYDGFKEHFTDLDQVDARNYGDYYKPEDIERQKVLEGYGYRFLRVNRFNLGRDPVRTLDVRLCELASDALKDLQPHDMVEETKETAESIINGDKKVCAACGEVRDLSDFKDSATKSGMGRKCRHCKAQELNAHSENRSDPVGYRWRKRRKRRW